MAIDRTAHSFTSKLKKVISKSRFANFVPVGSNTECTAISDMLPGVEGFVEAWQLV